MARRDFPGPEGARILLRSRLRILAEVGLPFGALVAWKPWVFDTRCPYSGFGGTPANQGEKVMSRRRIVRGWWFPLILYGGSVLSAAIHNVFYALFGVEEAFFLVLTLLSFATATAALVTKVLAWASASLVRIGKRGNR